MDHVGNYRGGQWIRSLNLFGITRNICCITLLLGISNVCQYTIVPNNCICVYFDDRFLNVVVSIHEQFALGEDLLEVKKVRFSCEFCTLNYRVAMYVSIVIYITEST
jgi:hypothetical protein